VKVRESVGVRQKDFDMNLYNKYEQKDRLETQCRQAKRAGLGMAISRVASTLHVRGGGK